MNELSHAGVLLFLCGAGFAYGLAVGPTYTMPREWVVRIRRQSAWWAGVAAGGLVLIVLAGPGLAHRLVSALAAVLIALGLRQPRYGTAPTRRDPGGRYQAPVGPGWNSKRLVLLGAGYLVGFPITFIVFAAVT